MKPCYLYKITNSVNGKLYIGISNNPQARKNQHWNFENRFNGKTISILYQAMRKYGLDKFSFEIICVGTKEYILDLEIKAIALYRTTEKEFGYNIKPGGEGGRGYSIRSSARDKPTYVSGFWFPNRRTALRTLNMSADVYKKRSTKGILGDTYINGLGKYGSGVSSMKPYYLAGFWFPNLDVAVEKLNRSEATLRARLYRGSLEEGKRKVEQSGSNNHMFGIRQEDHPSSKCVIIYGIEYPSIKQATAETGHSKFVITSRIKEGHPDFKFKNEEVNNDSNKISREL